MTIPPHCCTASGDGSVPFTSEKEVNVMGAAAVPTAEIVEPRMMITNLVLSKKATVAPASTVS